MGLFSPTLTQLSDAPTSTQPTPEEQIAEGLTGVVDAIRGKPSSPTAPPPHGSATGPQKGPLDNPMVWIAAIAATALIVFVVTRKGA